jgi:hypothetical protein
MRRMIMRSILLFSVICLLSGLWGVPTARALTSIKLCGVANGLADTIILSGTFEPGGPFVMDMDWIQFVPTIYTLIGDGALIRTIENTSTFSGVAFVGNNSDAFLNNPTCKVSSTLQIVQSQPFEVDGTARFQCFNGPQSPFTVSISFTLIPCDDPGLFAMAAERDEASKLKASPGWETRLPAGYAPNEYRE